MTSDLSARSQTLCLLIGKGGLLLKPFVPQLQTTFVKASLLRSTASPFCTISQG